MPESNLFPLKMLVISLGALLIAGMALVAFGLSRDTSGQCLQDAHLNLQGQGEIVQIFEEKGRLHVTLLQDNGEYLVLSIDTCTGKTLSSLTVSADENQADGCEGDAPPAAQSL